MCRVQEPFFSWKRYNGFYGKGDEKYKQENLKEEEPAQMPEEVYHGWRKTEGRNKWERAEQNRDVERKAFKISRLWASDFGKSRDRKRERITMIGISRIHREEI